MKLKALLITLALLLPAVAQAQIITYIDRPALSGSVVKPQEEFYVAGWVFDIRTGVPPVNINVALWDYLNQQWIFPRSVKVVFVERPDVQKAFSALVPPIVSKVGYHIYMERPPRGVYQLAVNWDNRELGEPSNVFVIIQ